MEQVGLFVDKRFPYPELAAIGHGHLGLEQVRPYLGDTSFAQYFKFAFVRNPFDRFVSYCAFMTRGNGAFERDPRAVMRQVMFKVRPVQHILFRPQYQQLVDADGSVLADFVGRVERMQADYEKICARLALPTATLGRVNSSRHGDYRQYYDEELRAGVADFYRRDLDLFKYAF